MDEIDRLLSDIDALKQFQAEPVPLATVPASQRVQVFLAEMYGPKWLAAKIGSYAMTEGRRVHVAFVPWRAGMTIRTVLEEADGELTEGQPLPQDDDPVSVSPAPDQPDQAEQDCIEEIVPALIEASSIIKDAKIGRNDKKRIRREITHAVKHLMMMRKGA